MKEAEPVLVRGLAKDPYSYACHLQLGELYRESDRFPLARQHFEFVVRFYPDSNASCIRVTRFCLPQSRRRKISRGDFEKGPSHFPHRIALTTYRPARLDRVPHPRFMSVGLDLSIAAGLKSAGPLILLYYSVPIRNA